MHYFVADKIRHEIHFLNQLLQNLHDPDSLTCVSILQLQDHYYLHHEEEH